MAAPKVEGRLGILVGGGPAPGINGVISAVTIEAINRGCEVIGIFDGYRWLMHGNMQEGKHWRRLRIPDVARIHFEGGSILHTSRSNPTRKEEDMQRVVQSLRELDIRYLVTIGGDDTAFSASQIARRANGAIRFAHVPKTIDNDLPLPGDVPTFGFETARHFGFIEVHNLMEDSRTTNRWYFVVAMGRSAGHLALGIGKAAGATLTIIPEEFGERVSLREITDILEGAILKRRAMGREDGVAIVAEGVLEKIPEEELSSIQGVRIVYDDYGHLRLAEMDLAHILKTVVERRFAERDEKITIVHKNVGYELRCVPPVAFDCEYVRDLGYGAVHYLLDIADPQKGETGAMVCVDRGQFRFIHFEDLLDAEGKMRVRFVNINTPSYQIAYEYMIRLKKEDFEDDEMLTRLAAEAKMSPEQFKQRFGYLVGISS